MEQGMLGAYCRYGTVPEFKTVRDCWSEARRGVGGRGLRACVRRKAYSLASAVYSGAVVQYLVDPAEWPAERPHVDELVMMVSFSFVPALMIEAVAPPQRTKRER